MYILTSLQHYNHPLIVVLYCVHDVYHAHYPVRREDSGMARHFSKPIDVLFLSHTQNLSEAQNYACVSKNLDERRGQRGSRPSSSATPERQLDDRRTEVMDRRRSFDSRCSSLSSLCPSSCWLAAIRLTNTDVLPHQNLVTHHVLAS